MFNPQINWDDVAVEEARIKAEYYLRQHRASMRKEAWLLWLKVRPMEAIYPEDFNEAKN